ncbi:hypothetical protein WJ09_27075 [Burkholderia vietnamiensis]|nr:hypothetical protein WJ09_27075 [Burkholderia vietnamiensis]
MSTWIIDFVHNPVTTNSDFIPIFDQDRNFLQGPHQIDNIAIFEQYSRNIFDDGFCLWHLSAHVTVRHNGGPKHKGMHSCESDFTGRNYCIGIKYILSDHILLINLTEEFHVHTQ